MRDDIGDQRRVFGWALPGSLVLHVLIAVPLMFGLPVSLSEPREEQAITVDLVPPPQPPEQTEAEPSAPEPEPAKPPEAHAGMPPPTSDDAARESPPPAVRPVFQFGEKDGGPRKSPDGDGAEDGSASPTAPEDEQTLAEAAAADAATGQAALPTAPPTPAPRPADPGKAQSPETLREAKTLFSQTAAGNAVATTAIGNVPRGVRAGRLCVTELREQLLNASPRFLPDLLPSEALDHGTILEIQRTAFRANGQWYDLSYRCEVDKDAMNVVSFAFRVGAPVPRGDWQRRGLPSQ